MKLLNLDLNTWNTHFPEKPFTISHNLVGHELLGLNELVKLSQQLPECSVEYNAGNIPVSQDPNKTPRNGLSIQDTIARIEQNRSWMALKNIEQVPAYRELLDRSMDQIREHSEAIVPGMSQREAFIFVSSPGSVTPYHMDPEHNFLLQIHGDKVVHMFSQADRSILSEQEIEKFYGGGHRNLEFREEYQSKAKSFELKPGQGLHFPINDPHWVKVGGSYSISLSITFRSNASKQRARLYFLNSRLRKVGLSPRPVGESRILDNLKYGSMLGAMRIKRAVFGASSKMGY